MRQRINFSREVLLVEIERRCRDAGCRARGRTGLTKAEARVYDGWTCERCERRWDDVLTERDVPTEWWEELVLTTLQGGRAKRADAEPGEVVLRMSEAWRRGQSDASRTTEAGASGVEANSVTGVARGETKKTGGNDSDGDGDGS